MLSIVGSEWFAIKKQKFYQKLELDKTMLTKQNLNVTLIWLPEQKYIEGNKNADKLARAPRFCTIFTGLRHSIPEHF